LAKNTVGQRQLRRVSACGLTGVDRWHRGVVHSRRSEVIGADEQVS